MRMIRNWIGIMKHYGGCLHCDDRWNWKKRQRIPYREGRSMSPLCRECFEKLDAKTIIGYCKKLIDDWKKWGGLQFDEKKAMKTIEDFVRKVKLGKITITKQKRVPFLSSEEFEICRKHQVTRFDFYDVVLTAIIDANPKIGKHPAIKDFFKRAKACKQEIKRGKLV